MEKEIKSRKSIDIFINISLYTLSIILVLCYFIILFLSIKPKVSWEYELYYISKESDVWPGMNGYDYYLDTVIVTNFENKEGCKRLGNGWGEYEENGVWSCGETSKIYFKNLPSKNLVFEMNLSKSLLNEDLEIYFNDVFVSNISANDLAKNMKISKEVKAEYITDGKLVVTLKFPELDNGEKDNYLHGIMCKEINLYEK